MLGKMIVDAALSEEFSLEYNGKPVAKIHKAGFATPSYSARCDFIDPKTAEQMLKARHYDIWVQSQHDAGKDPSNEEMAAAMTQLGLEQSFYDMRHGNLWVTKDADGVVTAIDIIDMDNNGLEWRPGKVIFKPKGQNLKTTLSVLGFIAFIAILFILKRMQS